MTKRDLVVKIAKETDLIQNDVAQVVQKTLDYIAAELVAGRTIELRNFGVFEIFFNLLLSFFIFYLSISNILKQYFYHY